MPKKSEPIAADKVKAIIEYEAQHGIGAFALLQKQKQNRLIQDEKDHRIFSELARFIMTGQ